MTDPIPADLFEELDAHASFLRALARRLAFSDDRADDLVQEAFVVAMESRTRPERGLRPWLSGVVRNLHRMRFRSEGRRRRHEEEAAVPGGFPPPEEVASRMETQGILLEAVRSLEEPYLTTVVLRFYEGLSTVEIADRAGIPAATVRTRLHRALGKLRERLDREHGGSRRAWTIALLPLTFPRETAAATGGASAVTAGAIAMNMKKTIAAAVILVALLGLVALEFPGREGPDGPEAPDETPPLGAAPATTVEAEETSRDASPVALVDLDAADRSRDLHGVVVDREGRPVPGALLQVIVSPFQARGGPHWKSEFALEYGARAESGANGAFSIPLEVGDVRALRITAPGHREVILPMCQPGEKLRVVLGPGAEFEVVARDEAGEPIEGVKIWLFRPANFDPSALHRLGVTGPDGRCVIDDLTPGRAMFFPEHAERGSVSWKQVIIPEEGRTTMELTLPTGRLLTGRVTDAATGEPVRGATVGEGPIYFRAVVTDEDGRYRLQGWSGVMRWLYCLADGYGESRAMVPKTGPLDFALPRGWRAEGTVVDHTDAPVSGATVMVGNPPGSTFTQRFAETDEAGRFTVRMLHRDQPLTFEIFARGHGRIWLGVPAGTAADDVRDLGQIRLPEPRALAGTVIDADGAGVPIATLNLHRLDGPGGEPLAWQLKRRTDDLGRFRFADLSPGIYRLSKDAGSSPPLTEEIELADRDREDLVIDTAGGARITVRVTDEEGSPIEGARVGTRSSVGYSTLLTGPDGVALLAGLPEEPLTIYVSAGLTRAYEKLESIVPANQEIAVVLEARAQIEGRLVGPDDAPLAKMLVLAFAAGTERSVTTTLTGEDGSFRLHVDRDAVLDLRVDGTRYPGGARTNAEQTDLRAVAEDVAAGVEDLLMRARRAVSDRALTVRVLDPEGTPLSRIRVGLDRTGQTPRPELHTGPDGRAAFEGLPADEVTVLLFRTGREPDPSRAAFPAPVAVKPAGQEIVIRLVRSEILTGTVVNEQGEPVARARVILYTDPGEIEDRRYLDYTDSDAQGNFTLGAPGGDPFVLYVSIRTPDDAYIQTTVPKISLRDGPVRAVLKVAGR